MFQIVIFSLNYGSCRDKKKLKENYTQKKKSFLTPKVVLMPDVWYHQHVSKAAPRNSSRCSAEAGSQSTPESCPFTPSWQRPPSSHSWICGVTQAQPYPSMPSFRKRKKKYPTDFKKSAQDLKGGSVVSPPHPSFKGVF